MGWGVIDFQESRYLLFRCRIALPLGILCGMAVQWLVWPARPMIERNGQSSATDK